MDYRRFFELLLHGTLLLSSGCATVRPEDKELLADSAMAYGSGGTAQAHEEHILSNREGSTSGGSSKAGGCGCN